MSLLAARERFEKADKDKKDKADKKDKKDKDEKKEKKDKDDDPAVKEALKSGQWREVKDEKTGKTYYYCPSTKQTTWDLKKKLKELRDAQTAQTPPAQSVPAQPPKAAEPKQSEVAAPTQATAEAAPAAAPQAASTPQSSVALEATPQSHDHAQPSATPPSNHVPSSARYASLEQPSYQDPVQRILQHNTQLQQMIASGTKGQVALDFQARYEALERTNNALSTQLQRLHAEHESMSRALTEANKKIHEQQVQLAHAAPPSERTKDEELQLTLSHLREQNRVLVSQISELTTLLARGVTETAAQQAEERAGRHAPGVGSDAAGGTAVVSRFLDSAARHTLCPNCVLSVTRYRDKLLGPAETNVGRMPHAGSPQGNGPVYKPVADFTEPPPTNSYGSHPRAAHDTPPVWATGYGVAPSSDHSGQPPKAESPAVMYGGFVVRNARATS